MFLTAREIYPKDKGSLGSGPRDEMNTRKICMGYSLSLCCWSSHLSFSYLGGGNDLSMALCRMVVISTSELYHTPYQSIPLLPFVANKLDAKLHPLQTDERN